MAVGSKAKDQRQSQKRTMLGVQSKAKENDSIKRNSDNIS
jgi:hypothetical protein